MSGITSQIKDNLKNTQIVIDKQAKKFGRAPSRINLIAVSKVQPIERVQAMLDCGHRLYGENRVQEAQARWGSGLRDQYPDDLQLHLIGPLQTNKAKEAVALFDVIETLDRPKLAAVLAAEMERQGRYLPCFIQVNTGEEVQKSGVLAAELPDFLAQCRDLGLNIVGLMCLPPTQEPPSLHFAFLKKLAEENGLSELSMGMSGDLEKAIALGATYIRVGTALFGARASS